MPATPGRQRGRRSVYPSEPVDRDHLVTGMGPQERLAQQLGVEEQRQARAVRVHDVRRPDQRQPAAGARGALDSNGNDRAATHRRASRSRRRRVTRSPTMSRPATAKPIPGRRARERTPSSRARPSFVGEGQRHELRTATRATSSSRQRSDSPAARRHVPEQSHARPQRQDGCLHPLVAMDQDVGIGPTRDHLRKPRRVSPRTRRCEPVRGGNRGRRWGPGW